MPFSMNFSLLCNLFSSFPKRLIAIQIKRLKYLISFFVKLFFFLVFDVYSFGLWAQESIVLILIHRSFFKIYYLFDVIRTEISHLVKCKLVFKGVSITNLAIPTLWIALSVLKLFLWQDWRFLFRRNKRWGLDTSSTLRIEREIRRQIEVHK